MGIFRPSDPLPNGIDADCSMSTDLRGMPLVGFCLWCGIDFCSVEDVRRHNASNSKAYPVFQQLKKGFNAPGSCQATAPGNGATHN
jgi:hypothetical protein